MRVSLLGTISASTADGPATISGDKQQTLLAVLALAAPRSVSDDRLIDELWGDVPPRNAPTPCRPRCPRCDERSDVTPCSARPTATRSPSSPPTSTRSGSSNSSTAARRGGRGRRSRVKPAAASRRPWRWCRAHRSASWPARGSLREAAAWLEGLVLDAHEGMVDALLATSRHAEVVDTLRSLVAEHPLRERFHAQLMIALYRCGRQSEALRAYRHAREVLLDELGLDPGPSCRLLERAILCHDATLAAPITARVGRRRRTPCRCR